MRKAPKGDQKYWSIRELCTRFTTEDTERKLEKLEKLEKMRKAPKGDQKYWSIRELCTRFTTEDTENAQRNTDLNAKRSENRSREHFLILKISFASFRVFREIRVRTRSLPFFLSFFSVCFRELLCVFSGKTPNLDWYAHAGRGKFLQNLPNLAKRDPNFNFLRIYSDTPS